MIMIILPEQLQTPLDHKRRAGLNAAALPCTAGKLRDVMDYQPDTGKLTWKRRGSPCFDNRNAGKEALTAISGVGGYRVGSIFAKRVYAHRVAFALHHGRWPEGEVLHRDEDRLNNRAENLVEASTSVANITNLSARKSASGHKGVRRGKRPGAWCAYIGTDKRKKHLGTFDTLKEAVAARKAAEVILGVAAMREALRAP